jgi:anti-sigma factor RsiW
MALHVEGDLAARKAVRLERHLAECAECRAFAARMESSQAAVKALAAEPADESALREVRARVLARIAAEQPRPRAFPLWRWAAVAVLISISVTGYVIPNLIPTLPPPPPGPTPVAFVQPIVPPPREVARVVRVRKPKPVVKKSEPLLVKLETNDPNVVIYWIVGE